MIIDQRIAFTLATTIVSLRFIHLLQYEHGRRSFQ
jgi:hypothetical protein